MNKDFGDWYREADIEPQHDTLTNRWSGIEAVAKNAKDSDIVELSRIFYGLSESGNTHSSLTEAMFNADSAFSSQNKIEIRLLAGVSLISIAENPRSRYAHLAAYAATCPSLLGRRSKMFMPTLAERAGELLDKASGLLRKHGSPKKVEVSILDDELTKIEESAGSNQFPQSGPAIKAAFEKVEADLGELATAIANLRKTQMLYREDSDILWWMTGQYSRDLDCPFNEIDIPGAAILIGKEMADLVAYLPGPIAARAVLHQCLQSAGCDLKKKSTLNQAVSTLPIDWKSEWFATDENRQQLSLCPISASLQASATINGSWGAAAESLTGVPSSTKLNCIEIAYQMYRECTFGKLT